MSAYNEYKTQFRDAQMLIDALKQMGFAEVEFHPKAQPLQGYHGDTRADTAEIIVRRRFVGTASNDMGFKRQEDGTFGAIISEFDRGTKYGPQWVSKLSQAYTERSTMRVAAMRGMTLLKREVKAGKTVLQFIKR